jgi:hypothetical protein
MALNLPSGKRRALQYLGFGGATGSDRFQIGDISFIEEAILALSAVAQFGIGQCSAGAPLEPVPKRRSVASECAGLFSASAPSGLPRQVHPENA